MNSDSDSDTSSAPSPSESASPGTSAHVDLPDLQRLIQHLVAAKRSLSSAEYVLRANELVTNSRTLLEEIAVLNARNTFVKRGVEEQSETLHAVKDRIVAAGDEAEDDFKSTIEGLDKANDRLQKTLASLRKTFVDPSLQGSAAATNGSGDVEDVVEDTSAPTTRDEDQTLHDFIDEAKHTELQTELRGLIDSFNDSRGDLDDTVNKFEDSLRTMHDMLSENPTGPEDKATIYDEPPLTIPRLFRGVENQATEMAALLQSLVSHYDLCVTALKHTEGGGEAAKRAMQIDQQSTQKSPGVSESLYLKRVTEPISDSERTEMLRILEHDAAQVEDVVEDVKERSREQESQYEELCRHAKHARSTDSALRSVLEMLHEMKEIYLPAHLYALQAFQSSWRAVQETIASKTDELTSLGEHHEGFLNAYSQLLREVDRRKAAERQIEKVAEKARKDVQRLYEADREARHDFMEEFGMYLPRDLWAGSKDEGVKWELRAVGRND